MVSEEDKKAIENIKRDINLAKEGEGFETEVLCDAIDLQTLLRLIENNIPKSLVEKYLKEERKHYEVYKKESNENENLKLGMYKHLGAKNMCEKILGIEKMVTLD